MSVTTNNSASVEPTGGQGQNYTFALTSLTFLFFIWGFITCLNDILIPHLKNVFDLTLLQASLVQFCFFFAYFVVSIPAGFLVKKVGYQRGAVIGLVDCCCRLRVVLSCRTTTSVCHVFVCFICFTSVERLM